MGRIPALTPREVIRRLKEHGFVEDHQTGSHLVLLHPERRQRVVVPVHSRDIPRGTLMSILRQAGLLEEKSK
jgi:predicted RNA binding protein YcfA (HicA-like mRNA interferase family)